jgi:hypothetical protein
MRNVGWLLILAVGTACGELSSDVAPTEQVGSALDSACVPETEVCDGVDNDCDGLIDESITNCETAEIPGAPPHEGDEDGLPEPPPRVIPAPSDWPSHCVDRDGDLVPVCVQAVDFPTDCNDDDPDIYPTATELCNGIDDNCNGLIDEFITNCETAQIPGAPPHEGDEDGLPERPPRAIPAPSDWPSHCVDRDGDLVPVCTQAVDFFTDCNDDDPDIYPTATELCNGVDDDCDGLIDERITNCETADIPGPPPAERD